MSWFKDSKQCMSYYDTYGGDCFCSEIYNIVGHFLIKFQH